MIKFTFSSFSKLIFSLGFQLVSENRGHMQEFTLTCLDAVEYDIMITIATVYIVTMEIIYIDKK